MLNFRNFRLFKIVTTHASFRANFMEVRIPLSFIGGVQNFFFHDYNFSRYKTLNAAEFFLNGVTVCDKKNVSITISFTNQASYIIIGSSIIIG